MAHDTVGTALCTACAAIPLDLFLPKNGSHRRFKNGKAWKLAVVYREGADRIAELSASASAGCPLCRIFVTALDAAEPLWAIGGEFTSRGHNMLLRSQPRRHPSEKEVSQEEREGWITLSVFNEGEMTIADGRRTGGLYWEVPQLGYGSKLDPINPSADSTACSSLALSWLENCLVDHKCSADQVVDFVPTRLIRVGDANGSLEPQLVITADWPSTAMREVPYLALSYCWGTDRGKTVAKTTKTTVNHFVEGIDMAMLPKTFQDAMAIVRKLDYRYIWIDALCIVQDDPADVASECAMMGEIYRNAILTICAASSLDGDGGCFLPRDPSLTQACTLTLRNLHIPYHPDGIMDIVFGRFPDDPEELPVTIYPNFGPWIKGIERGAVFQRGWCLQERELSPRVLHYTHNRLMWECRQCHASEDKTQLQSKVGAAAKLAAHLSSMRVMDDQSAHTISNAQSGVLIKRSKWEAIVEMYSRRKLSVKTDKLLAISGLAAAAAGLQTDDYLAGLWRENLLKGLAWMPKRGNAPLPLQTDKWPYEFSDEGIPSWSWASHDGEISFVGNSWFSSSWGKVVGEDGEEKWGKKGLAIEVIDAKVQLLSPEEPYGRVAGGELTLLGWLVKATLSEESIQPMEETAKLLCKQYYDSGLNATVYFDEDVVTLPRMEFLLLHLGTGKNMRGGSTGAENGMVLLPTQRVEGAYRRVGMFDIQGAKDAWVEGRSKGKVRVV